MSADLNRFGIKSLGDVNFRDVGGALTKLKKLPNVQECMIVQKCNCTEIYVVTEKNMDKIFTEKLLEFWKKNSTNFIDDYKDLICLRFNEEAIKHLLETAMGLKSLAIGDAQVYGQIKNAFKLSNEYGTSGSFLKILQFHMKKLSKKIDNYTDFRRGKICIPRAVGDIIERKYGSMRILIVGIGKMGSLLTKILTEAKQDVTIIDINENKSKILSKKYECRYQRKKELFKTIKKFGIVIFATNTPHLINKHNLCRVFDKDKDMIFIDMGNPPNIDPSLKDAIKIINLDFINQYSKENYNKRLKDMPKVNKLVRDELREIKISTASFHIKDLFKKINEYGAPTTKRLLNKILVDKEFVQFIKKEESQKMNKDSSKLRHLLKNTCTNPRLIRKFDYYAMCAENKINNRESSGGRSEQSLWK